MNESYKILRGYQLKKLVSLKDGPKKVKNEILESLGLEQEPKALNEPELDQGQTETHKNSSVGCLIVAVGIIVLTILLFVFFSAKNVTPKIDAVAFATSVTDNINKINKDNVISKVQCSAENEIGYVEIYLTNLSDWDGLSKSEKKNLLTQLRT